MNEIDDLDEVIDPNDPAPKVPEDRGDSLDDVDPEADDTLDADALAAIAADDDVEDEDVGQIPKSRFNQVNERRRIAEAEAARLKEELAEARNAKPAKVEQPAAADFDFDAKEEEYATALMEGDTKAAAALRRAINAELRLEAEASAESKVEARLGARDQKAALDAAVAEVLSAYSFLDSTSKEADKAAIAEVVEWRDFYISKGQSAGEAVRMAAAKIGPLYAKEDLSDSKPKVTDIAALRNRQALERNSAAALRQPATPGGQGERASAGRVNVAELSDKEFAALPEKEKKRLRGD